MASHWSCNLGDRGRQIFQWRIQCGKYSDRIMHFGNKGTAAIPGRGGNGNSLF